MGYSLSASWLGRALLVFAVGGSSGCASCSSRGATGSSRDDPDAGDAQVHASNKRDGGTINGANDSATNATQDATLDGATELDDASTMPWTDAAPPPPPCEDEVLKLDGSIRSDARVLINEIVADPKQDWSHSFTGVNRFDGTSEDGIVNSLDQYVELYNAGSVVIDIRSWKLEVIDTDPSTTVIGQGEALGEVYRTSGTSTLSAFAPGDFLLIGDPVGVLSTDAYYMLRSRCGVLVDSVEVGGLSAGRDFKGNGINNGAPKAGSNARARGVFEEAVARVLVPGSKVPQDTDDDLADFTSMRPTPLAPNVRLVPDPNDHTSPTVIAHPSGGGFPVTKPIRVVFDEVISGETAMGSNVNAAGTGMRVTQGGIPIDLGAPELEVRDSVLIVTPIGRLPFSATLEVSINLDHTLTDLAGNPVNPMTFSIETEAAPSNPASVLINEVVTDPQQDFSSLLFTGEIGSEEVTSDDEWIELLNLRPGTSNLRNYTLVIYNGPNNVTDTRTVVTLASALSSSSATLRIFGSGTSIGEVEQDDYIVVGNPPGALLQDVYIELRRPVPGGPQDGTGELVDFVEIGGNYWYEDRGGNGVNNGAPGSGRDGRSTGLDDEAVVRIPNGVDTGVDAADFCYAAVTLGGPNVLDCKP